MIQYFKLVIFTNMKLLKQKLHSNIIYSSHKVMVGCLRNPNVLQAGWGCDRTEFPGLVASVVPLFGDDREYSHLPLPTPPLFFLLFQNSR